jgi:hypothetical protein
MREKATRTVFNWFWAWNSDREELWLGRMARKGWRLVAPRAIFYRFERAEPAEVVFRLDWRNPKKAERDEYLSLFRDAGWEHAGEIGGWHYFRTPAGDGPPPEIHTDRESRMEMYRRLLGFLAIILAAVWVPFLANIGRRPPYGGFWPAIRVFQGIILLIWIYALIRIGLKIRSLKKDKAALTKR